MTSATIATEIGDIEIELFDDRAPRRRPQNFIDLAKKGFYDDVIFHRVIPGFVIQGGDGQYGKKSSLERGPGRDGGPGYKFEDEPVKGDYSAARSRWPTPGRTRTAASSSSATDDLTGKLPKNYTLFGQVTKGMDVVDEIVGAPRDRGTCRTSRSR